MSGKHLASEDVLHRVGVDCSGGDGGGPLVVNLHTVIVVICNDNMITILLCHLVDVLVEQPVVQQPVAVVEPHVVAEHADLGI